MAYCAQSDIEQVVGGASKLAQLAVDEDGGALADEATIAVISAAISGADAMVNSAIASRFSLPAEGSVPTVVTMLAARTAAYLLYERKQRAAFPGDKLPFEAVLEELKRIADGETSPYGLTRKTGLLSKQFTNDPATTNTGYINPMGGF